MGRLLKRVSVLKLWELQDKDKIGQGGHGGGKIKKPSILTFAVFGICFLGFRMMTITTVMAMTTTVRTTRTMMTKMLTITTLLESKAGWEDLASH